MTLSTSFGEFGAPKRSYELEQRLVTLLFMAKFFDNHGPIALAVHHQVNAIAQVARRVRVAHCALTQEQRVGVLVNLGFERVFQLAQGACNTPRKHWQFSNPILRFCQPALYLTEDQSDLIRTQVGKKFDDLIRNPCFAEVQGFFFRGWHAGLQSKKLALQLRNLSSRYRTNTSTNDCQVEVITDARAINAEAAKHYKSFVVGSGLGLARFPRSQFGQHSLRYVGFGLLRISKEFGKPLGRLFGSAVSLLELCKVAPVALQEMLGRHLQHGNVSLQVLFGKPAHAIVKANHGICKLCESQPRHVKVGLAGSEVVLQAEQQVHAVFRHQLFKRALNSLYEFGVVTAAVFLRRFMDGRMQLRRQTKCRLDEVLLVDAGSHASIIVPITESDIATTIEACLYHCSMPPQWKHK